MAKCWLAPVPASRPENAGDPIPGCGRPEIKEDHLNQDHVGAFLFLVLPPFNKPCSPGHRAEEVSQEGPAFSAPPLSSTKPVTNIFSSNLLEC